MKNRYNQRKQMNGEVIMALIKCPECGKEISDKSEICVYTVAIQLKIR